MSKRRSGSRRGRLTHSHSKQPIELLERRQLLAASLLADLNTSPQDASVFGNNAAVEVNGKVFFIGTTRAGDAGISLFCSDGTPGGTIWLKDLDETGTGVGGGALTVFNGNVYFVANEIARGRELWKTDGTLAGTSIVKDIRPGSGSGIFSNTNGCGVYNNKLYFMGNDGTHAGLWRTDGTTAGTEFVQTVGTGDTFPQSYVICNGVLYFIGSTASGNEPWRSDGTAAGTYMVRDVDPGSMSGINSKALIAYNGAIYFGGTDGSSAQLWRSDGTSAGTVAITGANMPGFAGEFAVVGGKLVYAAGADASTFGLYVTDGTSAGTSRLLATSGTSLSLATPAVTATIAFFNMNGGNSMVATDGTVAGTVNLGSVVDPSAPQAANGLGFFRKGFDIWRSDGTAAGTYLLMASNNFGGPMAAGNYAYAYVGNASVSGPNLWRFDGNPQDNVLFASPNAGTQGSTTTVPLAGANGVTYGGIPDLSPTGNLGTELFSLDTSGVRTLVADINPGSGSSSPQLLTDCNGTLYFTAEDGTHGRELWRSDGTTAGTQMVIDLTAGSSSSAISQIAYYNGSVYFVEAGGLWKTNGTAGGTSLVMGGAGMQSLTVSNNLYFSYDDGTHGRELWKSDGSPGGTALVQDLEPGSGGSSPTNLIDAGGTLFFMATTTAGGGNRLFRMNGTTPTDQTSPPISHGSENFSGFVAIGQTLYFTSPPGSSGSTLLSVSAANGTLKSVEFGLWPNAPMAASNGIIYFFVSDIYPVNPGGILRLDSYNPATNSFGPEITIETAPSTTNAWTPLVMTGTNINGVVYFDAPFPGSHGSSVLWKSDGKVENTVVAEQYLSSVQEIQAYTGNVFVRAVDRGVGAETFQVLNNTIKGTAGNDTITVADDPVGLFYDVYINTPTSGAPTYEMSRASWGETSIDAGVGFDTLVIQGAPYTQGYTFASNQITWSLGTPATVALTNVEQTDFDGGNDGVTGGGEDAVTITTGDTVHLTRSQRWVTLAVNVIGKLDLEGHSVTIDSQLSDPVGTWNGSAYTGVSGMVQSGLIVSTGVTGVGVGQTSIGPSGLPATLVRSTYAGDATLDGKINVDDYIQIDNGIAGGLTGWSNGDFNYDGKVNIDDYTIIDNNIAAQGPPMAMMAGSEANSAVHAAPTGNLVSAPALVWGDAGDSLTHHDRADEDASVV